LAKEKVKATAPCSRLRTRIFFFFFRSCLLYPSQFLRAMLLRLFPIASSAPADEQHKHFTRLLCGAFSARHANLAAKALGFPTADDGRSTLQHIRLTCLDRVAQVFRSLKQVAAP
jgi:hypothetical protein